MTTSTSAARATSRPSASTASPSAARPRRSAARPSATCTCSGTTTSSPARAPALASPTAASASTWSRSAWPSSTTSGTAPSSPPSGAFAAPPAPADSGPAPRSRRGGRARTATPDPGAVKDIGAELLRSARSLTVVRRFLRPGEAARYARSIERFLDGLESFPADRGGPDGAAPALLHIATRLRAQLETRIDDSGGNVTRACQRAIDLYARACREGRPNGVRLGRRLAKFRLASPGWPDVALNDFLPALGGKGVAAYRRAVDAAAEQAEAQGDRPGFELGSMLLELADLDGDVDRAVELLSREEHPQYAAIIERLVAAGRRDEALTRLDRAVAESRIDAPGPDPWRDADNPYWVRPGRALDLYLEAGRSGDALDLARDLFHSDPGPASLNFLLATAERLGRREEELDSALTWVDGRDWRTGDTPIVLALHLGDVDRAWAAADRWGVDLAWMSLADVEPQPRPDDAIELYRRDIERALLKAGRPSARRAAAGAVRMRLIAAAADARDGGGRVEAFTAWVDGLREACCRRPAVSQGTPPGDLSQHGRSGCWVVAWRATGVRAPIPMRAVFPPATTGAAIIGPPAAPAAGLPVRPINKTGKFQDAPVPT